MKDKLLYREESYKLRGFFMKVYNDLGPGLKENIYGNAFEELLKNGEAPYQREPNLAVEFNGKKVGDYRPDFVAYNKIIIELKSLPQVPKTHTQRVYQYLRSSDYKLGFIVNFGTPELQIIRRIYDK
jgi:GxxExxY protein